MACTELFCKECEHHWFANTHRRCPACSSHNIHAHIDEEPESDDDFDPEDFDDFGDDADE